MILSKLIDPDKHGGVGRGTETQRGGSRSCKSLEATSEQKLRDRKMSTGPAEEERGTSRETRRPVGPIL